MRATFILLIALAPGLAGAQDTSPYKSRLLDQYAFFQAYAKRVPPDSGSTPVDALHYVRQLAAALDEDAAMKSPNLHPALRRLDPYLVHTLSRQLGGRSSSRLLSTQCLLWTEVMVPNFAADATLFAAAPSADHAALVGVPIIANVVGTNYPYRCEVSEALWTQFTGAVDALSATAPAFLAESAEADSNVARSLRKSMHTVGIARPFIVVEDLRRAGQLAAAQAALEQALVEDPAPYLAVYVARLLANTLAQVGHPEAALAVLDRATPLAAAAELHADTVRAWYGHVAEAEAETRYNAASSGPILSLTGERLAWAEGLLDLWTGEAFDPAPLGRRAVLLDVWATWCGNCIAEFPDLATLAEQHGDTVAVVAVSVDAATGGQDLEGIRDVAKRHNLSVIALYDPRESGSVADLLGILGYPARFFFGPEGERYRSLSGSEQVKLTEVEAHLNRDQGQ